MNDWSDLEWIENFHADQLGEEQVQAFARRLRTDPTFTRLYSNYLSDEVIFIRAIESLDLEGSVGASSGGLSLRLPNWNLQWVRWPVSAFAALLLVVLIWSLVSTGRPDRVMATLDSASADAVIRRDGKRLPARAGVRLRSGDTLIGGSNRGMTLTYNDETVLTLRPNCRATFKVKGIQKHLFVHAGMVLADVTPQPNDQPMVIKTPTSTATVVGTTFTILVTASDSRIDVTKGRVHFANTTGSEDLIHAGEFAIASPRRPVIAQVAPGARPDDQDAAQRWHRFSESFRREASLIAYYDFQEPGTNPKRLTNRAIHSVQPEDRNGRIHSATWVQGRWPGKRALYFSEYGHVRCGRDSEFNRVRDQLTVFAWIRIKKFSKKPQFIFGRGNRSWKLSISGDNRRTVEFFCMGLEKNDRLRSRVRVDDNRWHLLVGVFDGAKIKLYIDGMLDVEREARGRVRPSKDPVTIGRGGPDRFDGWVDEAGLLDRAFSDGEILNLFRAGRVVRP
ncbi:MAG: LamG-like jellyroll fold domain-containing protein [Phycisphaeraceae bacterium]|nr:LamG-like jellyroll fold domain-containing protein [Phycisphaeraceae bacterium]